MRIFIIHSPTDTPEKDRILAMLNAIDPNLIVYDDNTDPNIADWIRNTDLILYLVSDVSLVSETCREYLKIALDTDKPMMVVRVRDDIDINRAGEYANDLRTAGIYDLNDTRFDFQTLLTDALDILQKGDLGRRTRSDDTPKPGPLTFFDQYVDTDTYGSGFEAAPEPIDTIDEETSEAVADDTPPEPQTKTRKLEAAMPGETQQGSYTELWVKISLPNSEGLAGELPAVVETGDLIEKEDVRGTTTPVRFDKLDETGAFTLGMVCLRVRSREFSVDRSNYPTGDCGEDEVMIEVQDNADTPTIIFYLDPVGDNVRLGRARLMLEVLQAGKIVARLSISTNIVASVTPQQVAWLISKAQIGGDYTIDDITGEVVNVGGVTVINNPPPAPAPSAPAPAVTPPPAPPQLEPAKPRMDDNMDTMPLDEAKVWMAEERRRQESARKTEKSSNTLDEIEMKPPAPASRSVGEMPIPQEKEEDIIFGDPEPVEKSQVPGDGLLGGLSGMDSVADPELSKKTITDENEVATVEEDIDFDDFKLEPMPELYPETNKKQVPSDIYGRQPSSPSSTPAYRESSTPPDNSRVYLILGALVVLAIVVFVIVILVSNNGG